MPSSRTPRITHWLIATGVLASLLGCSAQNPYVRVRKRADGRLEVDGPLAGPFKTTEALAAHACELMIRQPGASHGRSGMEYCALHYYAVEEDAYYLSYLSDIGGEGAGGLKYCQVPSSLKDLKGNQTIISGFAHTHPHNIAMSDIDLGRGLEPGQTHALSLPSRFRDTSTNRIWDRELYAFYRDPPSGDKPGPCFAFSYNYATRTVSALRNGHWIAIGKAEGEWGNFVPFKGQSWRPPPQAQ